MPINSIERPGMDANIDGSKIMPTGEGNNIPNQFLVEDTGAYRDVMGLSAFDFMDHTYNGSHGYRDRSYLIPSIREAFYERRRKMSYYINIFKPIIDAMVDPVFSATIERNFSEDETVVKFIDNCDNTGTNLTRFVKNCMATARISSICFVVVENFGKSEISESETENIKRRVFPYVYMKTAQEVSSWTTNKQGGLTSITFCDRIEKLDKHGASKRHYYIQLDDMMIYEYYIDNPKGDDNDVKVESKLVLHRLGVIPVIPILDFARDCNLKTLPTPELYNLAYLCFSLFQKESHVVMGELYQTYSLLYLSNWGRNGIQAGATNFIDCGPDAKFPPGYAAPPQEGLRTVISNCERLKEEIKNEAKQTGVVGIKQQQSGLAKEWDFRAEEVVLRETATAAVNLEKNIFTIFEKYMNKNYGYEVRYETSYAPNADDLRVEKMLTIIDRVPSGPLNEESQKEIVKIVWKDNPETIEDVIEDIDEDQAEKDAIGAMMKEEMGKQEESNQEGKKEVIA